MDDRIKAKEYENEDGYQYQQDIPETSRAYPLGAIAPETGKNKDSREHHRKTDNRITKNKDVFFYKE